MAITTDCTAIAGGHSYGQVAGGASFAVGGVPVSNFFAFPEM
jgi:hypothetical protein